MREFRLRTDLERHTVGAYQLPLGVEPAGLPEPAQGYTLQYQAAEEGDGEFGPEGDSALGESGESGDSGLGDPDLGGSGMGESGNVEPDCYMFHIVVSHERLKEVIDAVFALLPGEVTPVIEIGSRDAYRSVDVYVAEEPIPLDDFLRTWYEFEEIILEDICIGCGANSEDPWIEIFIDSWKGIVLYVPVDWRERIEEMLHRLALEEVPETWPDGLEEEPEVSRPREVLLIEDDESPDLDELLLELRERWRLALNVDPDTNLDDGGRELGLTLWHVLVLADPADPQAHTGADIVFWVTASSLGELEELIGDWFEAQEDWIFRSVFAMDRVAFDERPEDLSSLPARRTKPVVHLVQVERWQPGMRRDGAPPEDGGEDEGDEGGEDNGEDGGAGEGDER